jgi:LPXTG-motif cell wall-anchored protein
VVVVRRSRLFVIAVALTVAGGISLLGGIAWAAPNPPGNNGTVKVDDQPFDDHPNNEPHVGCTFQIDFYGFDQGELDADVTFEAHPPTLRPGGGSQVLLHDTVFIGEDDNSGGGSQAGLDASKTYTLSFAGITPHPVQGFHVKLTVHAEGSQGADTKHKVFWVRGCESQTTTTTTPGESSSTTTTTGGSSTTTTTTGGSGSSAPSSVGGSSTTAPGGSAGGEVSSTSGGGGLPRTGAGTALLLMAGASLLGLGAATVLGVRRRRA